MMARTENGSERSPVLNRNSNVATLPEDVDAEDRTLIARWEHKELFERGFVPVPVRFLELYSTLKPSLTSGEAMFVIQLMAFKWTVDAPFPGYRRLAKRMGVGDKAVRRYAAALEGKGYLNRISRVGSTNLFDLSPLFAKLKQAIVEQAVRGGRRND